MQISKFTLITMNKRNISNHRMSPRDDCSVEFQSAEGDISCKFNYLLERDSLHLVKNVRRLQLSRLLCIDDANYDSESSEFSDFEDGDSEWFAINVQGIIDTPTITKRSSLSSKGAAPVKRRSSVKYTAPLKEATKTSEATRLNRLLNRNMTAAKQDFRKRVRNTIGRNSMELNRDRLQKNAVKATQ
ncbi:unnamed protein product [Cylindrotheca closterium]|uniref:Uncharacterized protein n=1 Tax=Cylindrotheca closterium TaxID=2856 RepID=A0AAD2CT24_9STRA|nr:unnamed protein product [Cylindrotheca closterium]